MKQPTRNQLEKKCGTRNRDPLSLINVYCTSLGMIVSKEDWNSSMSQAVVEAAHIINKVREVLS
jgi:hypothetical protein